MASRQPVYHEQHSGLRIISVPNGLWVLQEHIGRPKTADPRTTPNWRDISPALDRNEALSRLKSARPGAA